MGDVKSAGDEIFKREEGRILGSVVGVEVEIVLLTA
jgi:hypothetical protein